jgi:hypothetical protein
VNPHLELLAELRARGVMLTAVGDRLRYRAPKGALTAELRQRLTIHKPELLAALRDVDNFDRAPSARTSAPRPTHPSKPDSCFCGSTTSWQRPPDQGGEWVCARCHSNPADLLAAWERRGEVAAEEPIILDPDRARLLDWALAQGCPELRFRPWMTVVGTAHGWRTFVVTASTDDIAAALEAAGLTHVGESS